MAGVETGREGRDNSRILWVGRSEGDPYWARCSAALAAAEFDSLYDAVTDVLIGRPALALVVNALALGPELQKGLKSLLLQGLVAGIYVYTPVRQVLRITPNGDPRVVFVDDPEQLLDRLKAAVAPAAEEPTASPEVAERPGQEPPPSRWPEGPPAVQDIVEIKGENRKETEGRGPEPVTPTPSTPANRPEDKSAGDAKEFQAAELTQEELQALLGPEFEAGKEKGPTSEHTNEHE